MRTFARHMAGVIVGMFSAALVAMLTGLGVPESEVVTLLDHLQEVLVMAILVAGYFITEKGLKRFKHLFPDAWAEKVWKDHAGDVVSGMDEATAERAIQDGRV